MLGVAALPGAGGLSEAACGFVGGLALWRLLGARRLVGSNV